MLQTNIRFCCWRIIWVVCLMSPLLFAAIITLSITNHRVHRTTTGSTATTEPTTTLIKNTTSTIVILPSLGNGRYARLSRRYLAEPQVSDGLIQGCMVDNNKILPNQVSGSESQCLKFVDDPLNFYCLLFFLVVALLWCVSWLFGDYYCSTIDRNLGLRNADVHPTTAWCNRYSRSKSEYSDDLPVRDYHKTRIGTQNGKSSRGNHLSDDDSFHDENGLNKSLDDNAASNARHPVERRMYVEIFGLTKFLKMVVPKLYGEPISDLEASSIMSTVHHWSLSNTISSMAAIRRSRYTLLVDIRSNLPRQPLLPSSSWIPKHTTVLNSSV